MHGPATIRHRLGRRWSLLVVLAAWFGPGVAARASDPLVGFELPDEWEAQYWASPDVKAVLELKPDALAKLVPKQAGLRYCRCPGCDAAEADDPLAWSARKPDVVACRKCKAEYPNDKVPAKVENKVPTETVQVTPTISHAYPYEKLADDKQRYPDERLYLEAKRDYEAREFLAKFALYAAVRHGEQPAGAKDPALARAAAVLILRFAQVYPLYALHLDQPGMAKSLEPARMDPPYRRGYRTGKWDWTGSQDVPLNLVIAYAKLRDDPAIAEAGRLLNDAHPARTIEVDLFRASAGFAQAQPAENDERSLQVDRGVLAVGRLLGDAALVADANRRLNAFAEAGFYHDGLWRQGDARSHRTVMALLDGWIERLLLADEAPPRAPKVGVRPPARNVAEAVPMLALARSAGASAQTVPALSDVRLAAWPAPTSTESGHRPALLGGAGLAHLAVGQGEDALDLELRGMGNFGSTRSRRQALRLAVGGQVVLGDLDELPPRPDGWDLSSAAHNTVMIDGLNHRESVARLRESAVGGNWLFFAADPDLQVAVLDDPKAYPTAATRFRQTVVVSSGPKERYAVSVFEVQGGRQHDQIFHGPAGSPARWEPATPVQPGPATLLPPNIPFLATTSAADNRWFVQSYGEFADLSHARLTRPTSATLAEPGRPGVRLHVLGDMPAALITARTPHEVDDAEARRSALLLRRRSNDGEPLRSTFVSLFEPIGTGQPAMKVGRAAAPPGVVILYLETADGPEHLIFNDRPGTARTVELADGRSLVVDGLVTRVRGEDLAMAGGTEANLAGTVLRQPRFHGEILSSTRFATAEGRGWFETDAAVPPGIDPAGRTLLIRHGDGTTRGWTLVRVEPVAAGRVRLHVREEPGFLVEGKERAAHYYQFPGTTLRGPHQFNISGIGRAGASATARLNGEMPR
ncbi:hypothetical protein TA3x_001313 [Tundrisphaera sp. TA3]|uniref:hypothetical protein n=1 Tax=Tundrisphaera sp. TA3 TaxID=3435775 RepID=UPI003EB6F9CA